MTNTAEHLRVIEGANQDPLVGATIDGRYAIERVLGEGGMGLVYRARHIVLNKPLAVKVLRPDVSRDAEIITRFRQEAQSASAIGNQHIIDISDFGTLPDASTYFVMEFLDGSDLTKVIEHQSPIPPQRIIHIAKQLCDALGAAHDIGIVHRDLKPDNIYLIKRGQDENFVKVLDFGIAKVGGSSSKLTRAGQVFGTPHYMSPEQCAGSGVDHRTDIYAIGIILYEMVTGRTPFDADNLMGILTKHLYEQAVPPSQIRTDCPKELESVILRCIAKQADQRYQTCYELLDDLKRLEAGLAPLAPIATARTSPGMPAPAIGAPEPAAGETQKKGKTGLFVGAAVLALLGAGGAAAFLTLGNGGADARPPQVTAERPETPTSTPPTTPTTATPQPAQNPATAAGTTTAQAPAEQPKVRLVSDPAAAEVWNGDALLGNTPLEVPRPTGEARLEIELRLPGYQARQVTLSALTLSPELRFVLERERGGSSHGTSTRPTAPSTSAMTPAATPPTTETPRRTRPTPQSEVLDPWAN